MEHVTLALLLCLFAAPFPSGRTRFVGSLFCVPLPGSALCGFQFPRRVLILAHLCNWLVLFARFTELLVDKYPGLGSNNLCNKIPQLIGSERDQIRVVAEDVNITFYEFELLCDLSL